MRKIGFLLFACFILLWGCNRQPIEADGMNRPQFERFVFNSNNVSKQEMQTLFSLKDTGTEFAYFRGLPDIRGYTSGNGTNLFLVNFIIAYNFKNRNLGLELGKQQMVIVDHIRNKLSQLNVEDFAFSNEENLRTLILTEINQFLKQGQAEDILFNRIEIYPLPSRYDGR